MLSEDVRYLKGYAIIRSHIGFTQKCGVVLKLERFSHLSGQSFGLSFLIGLEALLLVLSLRVSVAGEGYLEKRYLVHQRWA